MKRLLGLLIVGIFLLMVPASYLISAGKKAKVDVCHNNHVINVSESALPAHLAHGDCEDVMVNDEGVCVCDGHGDEGDDV